jgi:hypothetical protein
MQRKYEVKKKHFIDNSTSLKHEQILGNELFRITNKANMYFKVHTTFRINHLPTFTRFEFMIKLDYTFWLSSFSMTSYTLI